MRDLLAIALATALCAACGGSTPTGGCADPSLIDDMEDNDRFICASAGRTGAWFVIDDGTSTNISPRGEFTQSEIPGGRGASRHAAHMTGFGFLNWGAAMGFSLNGEGDAAQTYDASATGGVRFWMKSNVPIGVAFPIPETLANGTAAACVDDAREWNCDNHFQFVITAPTSEWIEYDVPYSAAAQAHRLDANGDDIFGSAAWHPTRLVAVEFRLDPLQTFDVWVDDVRFYSCAAEACLPTCKDPGLPVACPATSSVPAGCWAAGTVCARAIAADLPGVWGTGPNDVWIVGSAGTILRWNGSTWSTVASATSEWLSVPSGNGPDDVWIVGTGGTILRWDGSRLSAVASGTTQALFGVWTSGPSDAWAVGASGTILHWDGSVWSAVPSGTSYRLWRVWGSGPDDVWAVGNSDVTGSGIIVHWNGSTWSPAVDAPAAALIGVWGLDPTTFGAWALAAPSFTGTAPLGRQSRAERLPS